MRINEKAVNMKITPEIKEYLYKKLEAIEKFLDPTDESALCNVELGKTTNHHKKGDVFRTEINLHIAGKDLRAEAEEVELFATIDLAKDEMVREIKSNKDKKVSMNKKGGAKIKKIVKEI